jgi:hypothetical protein
MRLLRAATIVAVDPDATARRYADWFDYRIVETGSIAQRLADGWGAPAMAGRRFVVMAPASGAAVFLRFVAGARPADVRPMRSHGWAALELCVQDVLSVHARLATSPFTIIGPPRALDGAPAIWPMQVLGPDGEMLFLTEIRNDSPHERLPRAAVPVDELFIAVLACADLAASRAWFETRLALSGAPDLELAYTSLSKAFGLPATQRHKIAVLTHETDAFLQLDQFPPQAGARDVIAGELPGGIAMVSFLVPHIGQTDGGTRYEGVIYGVGQSVLRRAPDNSPVEFVYLAK